MALSKIDTAAIATDAIEAAQLKSDAVASGDLPNGTVINTEFRNNATYTNLASHSNWTNVWTFNYVPKLAGTKIFFNFSVNILPEANNGHDFWMGIYDNAAFNGSATGGQQFWYEVSRAAGMSGWNQDQAPMQTFFNNSYSQGSTMYCVLQMRNGTGTGSSYFNYSNGASTLFITEVAT